MIALLLWSALAAAQEPVDEREVAKLICPHMLGSEVEIGLQTSSRAETFFDCHVSDIAVEVE